jgi:glycolate oxidase
VIVDREFLTTTQIVAAARRNLDTETWSRLASGSETETTLRRNRLAFDALALRPRVLAGVEHVDASTTVLGHRVRIPVLASPIGSAHLFAKDGAIEVARAADSFGTIPMISSTVPQGIEAVASSTGGPKILQIALGDDLASTRDVLRRGRDAGYIAACFGFDSPRFGRLEREIMATRKPTRSVPRLRSSMTWSMLDDLVSNAGLPLIAKGITHPDDAVALVDRGFAMIHVSNHGGQMLDHARGSMDALPELVEAVGGRAEVILDSGVMRGTDVLKALAMGARAVAIGRLQCLGLAAGGEAGLYRTFELLEEELFSAMSLLGTRSVGDITRDHVVRDALPVDSPTWLSAFPLLAQE